MIKVVLVDDDKITHKVITSYIDQLENVELIGSFLTPIEAVNFFQDNDADIVFLDVEMPEIDGFTFLNMTNLKSSIVIISSDSNYALKAFGCKALDYLHKRIEFERFFKAIKRFKEQSLVLHDSNSNTIFVRVNRQLTKVETKDILSVTADGDYVKILLKGNIKLHIYGTLTNFSRIIPDFLMRVHRKHIININEIEQISESGCYISKEYYPIGKTFMELLKSKLNIF